MPCISAHIDPSQLKTVLTMRSATGSGQWMSNTAHPFKLWLQKRSGLRATRRPNAAGTGNKKRTQRGQWIGPERFCAAVSTAVGHWHGVLPRGALSLVSVGDIPRQLCKLGGHRGVATAELLDRQGVALSLARHAQAGSIKRPPACERAHATR
jgi:hypothetical protein